ncbi:Radical SAM domain protein [Syntrophobotulus glycolicus DSM 8271]|uniref:Radical SAM domain protein n=1 Tax=Syntrophobotulus glycolicus (strain DSM 8271 / FlGlyR) TaxID=645991 RepID=F0T2L5_SYNGF|nr:TatD family nuclease-associated radical SAM protein [Syntrophobotulus glycolicus]ADY55333.1 Radical SAM domain protein [Syntrophobotulus glycolicus DSM 8271]
MIMTYEIEDNLYVNLTNRCPNACRFCIRNKPEAFAHDLWLDQEPSAGEVIREILARELSQYRQLVFCGFGEPLERLEEVLEIVRRVKEKNKIYVRINTNGLAGKIHRRDVTPQFETLIDGLSISLNAGNAEEYDAVCHSVFGLEAFPAILDFAAKSKAYVQDVQFSVVDCLPPDRLAACRKIAAELDIPLKVRREVKA